MKKAGTTEWVSVSLTIEEKRFLEDKLISPTKLFKWALEQKGFKKTAEK